MYILWAFCVMSKFMPIATFKMEFSTLHRKCKIPAIKINVNCSSGELPLRLLLRRFFALFYLISLIWICKRTFRMTKQQHNFFFSNFVSNCVSGIFLVTKYIQYIGGAWIAQKTVITQQTSKKKTTDKIKQKQKKNSEIGMWGKKSPRETIH